MSNRPITAERIAGIKEALASGMTITEIAGKYKVGSVTIHLVEEDRIQPGDCHPKSSIPPAWWEQIDYVCIRYGSECARLWREWDEIHARYGRRATHG